MKLHVLSDIHTEFAEFSPPDTGADVVILAGDIGVGLGGIEWAASQFPEESVELHESSKAWLEAELDVHFNGPTVVVTHHLPASMSVAKCFASDSLNPAFASRLEGVIEKYRPELWIHGHTHVTCDYDLFNTRVVCNPRGYPRENRDRAFDPGLIVEVSG